MTADRGNAHLRVAVSDGRGRRLAARGLARWLTRVAPLHARGEVTIALVSDRHIQDLNRRFRRKDIPTDVLAFPVSARAAVSARPRNRRQTPSPESRVPGPARYLGDIAIATGVARRQAREAGHSYATELRVLALHGLLHLIGYDHHDATDRERMARVEGRLRRKGGLSAGLIERNR